ncbi:MAG: dockerin type I repeat-containing protein [Clostridia bacterium]|nr:dockerin type I repeat-containing protein [Clostridia bacterium]
MKNFLSLLLTAALLVSVTCLGVTATVRGDGENIYISQTAENMQGFTERFEASYIFTDGVSALYGYSEAKVIHSRCETDANTGILKNTAYTWLAYDAAITLTAVDDTMSDAYRSVNLVYANGNPKYYGTAAELIPIAFGYDPEEGCFRLTEGVCNTDPEAQLMDPVYKDIGADDGKRFTLGISVDRGRIRCYCDDTMIFDFEDTDNKYRIADAVNSPFVFYQDGNFVAITEITVAEAGTLFAATPGDANGDGKVNMLDVTAILKYCAKWELGDGFIPESADTNGDGKVSVSDTAYLMRYIAGWYKTLWGKS